MGDPRGGGRGAQEGNGGGDGNFVHFVCFENDDPTLCMRVRELKLLASDQTYPDIGAIDWDAIDPVQDAKGHPPVIIQPGESWCYPFYTTGSYLGKHIYVKYDAVGEPCGKAAWATGEKDDEEDDPDMISIGDHPVDDRSLDTDGDGLWDSWEEVYGLDPEDDGTVDINNGPLGDPDGDSFDNLTEQSALSNPLDPSDPEGIPTGYDFYRLEAPTTLEFGVTAPPLPPDFFGPGSDPFIGPVFLVCTPVSVSAIPPCAEGMGAPHVILHRKQSVPLDDLSAGGLTPAEVTACAMRSMEPIAVTYEGGSTRFFDVFYSVSPDFPAEGLMAFERTHGNGGYLNFSIMFSPRLEFVDVDDPANVFVLHGASMDFLEVIQAANVPWEFVSPRYVCNPCTQNFHPGVQRNGGLSLIPVMGMHGPYLFAPECDLATFGPGDVMPGYDLLSSRPLSEVRFGTHIPPIPADFFDPGSEPFFPPWPLLLTGAGPVAIEECTTETGDAAAVVLRRDPAAVANEGDTATIPIELVELSLVSVEPIHVVDSFFDVYVELSLEAPSTGTMTITRTHPNGGVFDAILVVQPVYTFVNIVNTSDVRVLDMPRDYALRLECADIPWSDDPLALGWPGCASNFVPGMDDT
ncbi:MAG TPA: hypothetical protein ENN65_07755, partial [Candidatus Hydrogenedentes bacterium]|nr:hypothetical protein [Candidatus Hydrogenedentota bacterium]